MKRYVLFLLFLGCAQKGPIITEEYKEGVFLGFNFVPGNTLRYKNTIDMSSTIEVAGGMSQSFQTLIDMKTTQTVIDTGETTRIQVTFDKVGGSVVVGTFIRSIEEAHELEKCTLVINLSREHEIIDMKGSEFVLKYLKHTEAEGKMLSQTQFAELFSFLPNKTIKIGEKWVKQFNGTQSTYTLEAIENKDGHSCAKIKVEGIAKENITYNEMSSEISGKFKGTIYFALDEKILIEEKTSLSSEGKATGPGGMNIPIFIDATSKTVIIR